MEFTQNNTAVNFPHQNVTFNVRGAHDTNIAHMFGLLGTNTIVPGKMIEQAALTVLGDEADSVAMGLKDSEVDMQARQIKSVFGTEPAYVDTDYHFEKQDFEAGYHEGDMTGKFVLDTAPNKKGKKRVPTVTISYEDLGLFPNTTVNRYDNPVMKHIIGSPEAMLDLALMEAGMTGELLMSGDKDMAPLEMLLGWGSGAIIAGMVTDKIVQQVPSDKMFVYHSIDTMIGRGAYGLQKGDGVNIYVKRTSSDGKVARPSFSIVALGDNGTEIYSSQAALLLTDKPKGMK